MLTQNELEYNISSFGLTTKSKEKTQGFKFESCIQGIIYETDVSRKWSLKQRYSDKDPENLFTQIIHSRK